MDELNPRPTDSSTILSFLRHSVSRSFIETMETRQLPFFVYGTLQRGFKNNKSIVRGRESMAQRAKLPNAIVYHFRDVGCPGVFKSGPSDAVYGELLSFDSNVYHEVLNNLDILEEYYGPEDPRNQYERVATTVAVTRRSEGAFSDSEDEEIEYVEAYVYFSLHVPSALGGVLVTSGDWRQHLLETGEEDTGDDWAAAIIQGAVSRDESRKSWSSAIFA